MRLIDEADFAIDVKYVASVFWNKNTKQLRIVFKGNQYQCIEDVEYMTFKRVKEAFNKYVGEKSDGVY